MVLLNNIFKNIKKVFNKKNTKNNDIECGKTYSIQDINKVDTTPIYKNFDTISIFFIKHNIDDLLNKIIDDIKRYCEQINIGIEIEFYIDNLDYKKFVEITTFFCKKNTIDIIGIDKEWGSNQVEIKFNIYSNINKLINDYNNLKNFLINTFDSDFSTCHFLNDSFSALQLNITLMDNNGDNLFARTKDEYGDKVESKLLVHSVNGILDNINILLPLYIKNRRCLERFDFDRNIYLYNEGKIPAPTYISWGINNRTASIRIPTPTDFNNYDIIDKISRRIEFRVPSSDADLKLCIFGVLSSIYYGIENKLDVYEKSNFNILGNNKNLEKIELKEIFLSDEKIYRFFNSLLD